MQKPIEWDVDSDRAMGERIRAVREARGLSMRTVADKLAVTKASVGHWETAARAIKHKDLARLCSLLQISADELLFGARRWPFTGIDFDLVNDLEPLDLGRLEGAMAKTADEFGFAIKKEANPGLAAVALIGGVDQRDAAGRQVSSVGGVIDQTEDPPRTRPHTKPATRERVRGR